AATSPLDAAAQEDQCRLLERNAGLREHRRPGLVERGESVAGLLRVLIVRADLLGGFAGLPLLDRRLLLHGVHRAEHLGRVDPEDHGADQRDHQRAASDLSAATPRKASASTTAAANVDTTGLERVQSHRASLLPLRNGLDQTAHSRSVSMSQANSRGVVNVPSDKRALVTGSTSGIGLAVARALAAEGAEVVLSGFGEPAEIESLCREMGARHVAADLTSAAGVEGLMDGAGPIDILVNNAGMQH